MILSVGKGRDGFMDGFSKAKSSASGAITANRKSRVDAATLSAYRETSYQVQHSPPFHLRLDSPSREVGAIYKQTATTCCAFITAGNPHSEKLTAEDNAHRQAELAKELNRRGLHFIAGVGSDPQRLWPDEPSYLVLGISLEAAKQLGRRYAQNAIVCCGPDATPRLELLR